MEKLCLVLVLLLPAVATPAETQDAEMHGAVEHLDQRYDDFFRRRHQLEEQDELRRKAAGDMSVWRKDNARQGEEAREKFVKDRKVLRSDPRLEEQWNEEKKAWKAQNQSAGKHYVERRDQLDKIEKHGRTIPPMEEFDLHDED